MYPIQEFWLVALAAADKMAIWPLPPISLARMSTSDSPMVWLFAWLMNRWFGLVPQEISESKERILMPCWDASSSDGHSALGSLPAITIALACAWIAAWTEGICAAAVSCVPLLTTTLPPSWDSACSPPLSARTSYGFCVSFGMKYTRSPFLYPAL